MHRRAGPLNNCSYSPPPQVPLQLAPTLGLDLVFLIDVEVVGIGVGSGRQCELLHVTKLCLVACRDVPAPGALRPETLELVSEYCCLQIVEPRVETPGHDASGLVAPVIAKQRDLACHGVVVGHDRSPVAKTAQHLGGIEAERACGPE